MQKQIPNNIQVSQSFSNILFFRNKLQTPMVFNIEIKICIKTDNNLINFKERIQIINYDLNIVLQFIHIMLLFTMRMKDKRK